MTRARTVPYQFALIRYLNNETSGEFVNVGLLMWSPSTRRLVARVSTRYSRMAQFFLNFDGLTYREVLSELRSRIASLADALQKGEQLAFGEGAPQPLPRDFQGILERVLRTDATALRWSPIMGGVVPDPEVRADELFEELIRRHEAPAHHRGRTEEQIWSDVDRTLEESGLGDEIERHVRVSGSRYEYTFHAGWMNGKRQVMQPISFDLMDADTIVEKANTWSGRLYNLSKGNPKAFEFTAVVAPPSRTDLRKGYSRALGILEEAPAVREIVSEGRFQSFIRKIEEDLGHK